MTNPLVAQQPESNDGFITKGSGDAGWGTGIGIAESVNDVSSLNEGSNWVESGLAYGGLAMEAVSAAVDPIGTLLSYGLSWLIEHVQPLKEALDWFAGDPDGVAAYGKTWENVSKAVSEAAEQYNAAVKADTADWAGAAGDAYRKTAAEKAEALTGAAQLAGTISSVVTIMGEVVSFVREFVRDLVADCVSRLITYALEAVLPPIASLAWVIPQAVAFISKTVTKIVDIVTKLTKTISNVSPKLAKLAEVFGDLMKTLGNMGKATAGGIGKVADKLDVAEHLAKKTWQKVDDTFGTDVVGRRNARMGGPDAPDGSDSAGDSGSGGGSGGSSSTSESGGSGSSGASGSSSPGDAQPSVRTESVGDSSGSRSEPGSGGSTPGGRTEAEPGTSGGRTDAGSGSQSHADADQGSGGSSRTDSDSGSGSGGSSNSDAGSQSRTDSPSDAGPQARTDSSPDSGSGARPDTSPDSGPQVRPETSTSGGAQPDSGSAGQSQSSGAGSGGSSTHTSDVPREPAHTSAAGVDAPARPPETAAPQSAPSGPRPDQPSGAAPSGGANAPGSPSAPGGGTPSPRGGRQGGQGGWTGSSGHPGAARDLPSHAPRTPRSPSHPPGPRPNGPGPAHPHAPRGGSPVPRQAPHTPAPMRSARPDAPHSPARPGTPVQRQQVAPPRPEQLRTADSPRTPIPAQRTPDAPNSLPEQPRPDEPKISTSDSMAAETPPKDQWQAGHHMVEHTPRLDISPELRNKLGSSLRDIEATGAGLSFTKPPVKDYFGRADWAHKRPRCSVDPNRFTIEMHGSPNGVKFKGNHLDAKELAEIIRGSSGYEDGTPIRLVSCETGADVPDGSKNFAQQLSEELGVEVLAPNTNAWVDNYGNIYANESSAKFDKSEPGTPKPRLDSPGEWTAFRPDGTKAVHSSPYPPGHQPEWVRHGIQAEGARMRGIFGRRKDEDFSTDPVTGHNFSNAPPQGHYGPPQGNYGPPQGQYGPPPGQFPPQQHFPQQGNVPQGQHFGPQGQAFPQQGQTFGPQGQHFPQQGNVPPRQQNVGQQGAAPPPQGNFRPAEQNFPPSNRGFAPQGHPQQVHPSPGQQPGSPQNHPSPARGGQPQHAQHTGAHPQHRQGFQAPGQQQVGAPGAHQHQPTPPPRQGGHAPPQQHGYPTQAAPGRGNPMAPPPQNAQPPAPPRSAQQGVQTGAPMQRPQSPVAGGGHGSQPPAGPRQSAAQPGAQAPRSQQPMQQQGAPPQASSTGAANPGSAAPAPPRADGQNPTAQQPANAHLRQDAQQPRPEQGSRPEPVSSAQRPSHVEAVPPKSGAESPSSNPATGSSSDPPPGASRSVISGDFESASAAASPDANPQAVAGAVSNDVAPADKIHVEHPDRVGSGRGLDDFREREPAGASFDEQAPDGWARRPEFDGVGEPGTPVSPHESDVDDLESAAPTDHSADAGSEPGKRDPQPAAELDNEGSSGSSAAESQDAVDGHGDDSGLPEDTNAEVSELAAEPKKDIFEALGIDKDDVADFELEQREKEANALDVANTPSATPTGEGDLSFVASQEHFDAFERACEDYPFRAATADELVEVRSKDPQGLRGLCDAEISSVVTYTGDNGSCYALNEALRSGGPLSPEQEAYRAVLTSALNKIRANMEEIGHPAPSELNRKVSVSDIGGLRERYGAVGNSVRENGFLSTTPGQSNHVPPGHQEGSEYLVNMTLVSHSGADISGLSRYPGENEILCIGGREFAVTHYEERGFEVDIRMEEVRTDASSQEAYPPDSDAPNRILSMLDGELG